MMIKSTAIALALFFVSSISLASPVNINTASAVEIADALSGIGIVKAEALVVYRQANGVFDNAEHIVNVRGIGPAIYEKNKIDILVE